jgi:hypothetical protein
MQDLQHSDEWAGLAGRPASEHWQQREACMQQAREDDAAGDGQREHAGAKPEALSHVIDFLIGGDGQGGSDGCIGFHNRTELAHQDADAAQENARPKPGPHQRADGHASFLQLRGDECLTMAITFRVVVHMREDGLQGLFQRECTDVTPV